MLQNSFIQLPGVGLKKEELLWKKGVLNWDDFILQSAYSKYQAKENKLLLNIEACINKLSKKDATYFYNILPFSESWRLYKEFRNHCLYLDIETNGGDLYSGFITTIATYDGNNIKYYVNGENLDDFIKDVFNSKILVTYNGILPDLFREEQGLVALGKIENKNFSAIEILAKNDENYMQKEVSDMLKKNGKWKGKLN